MRVLVFRDGNLILDREYVSCLALFCHREKMYGTLRTLY